MTDRHPAIVHWTEIQKKTPHVYSHDEEPMAFNAPLARHLGLTRIGIHHERLPAGRRLSFPHAESAEEEFVYVLEGTPDAWLDDVLHRLGPGDSVGFPAGTGLCHTFINNSEAEVSLLVVGEANKDENRIFYAVNPERKALRTDWWDDVPRREQGPHDGLPDALRAARAAGRKPGA